MRLERLQLVESIDDSLTGGDQIRNQALVGADVAFVLAAVANVMAFGQNAPYLRTKAEGMRKDLKYDVAICWPITGVPQRCQAQGVRRIVGEVESALD